MAPICLIKTASNPLIHRFSFLFGPIRLLAESTFSASLTLSCSLFPSPKPQRAILTRAVAPHLLHLVLDPNGTHVIHAILDHFQPSESTFIMEFAMSRVLELGVNQHGLCVLKKCLSVAPMPTRTRMAEQVCEGPSVV